MSENLLTRVWRRIIFKLNVLLGEDPDEMLLQEQVDSYQNGIDGSYAKLKSAGGTMGETLGVLTENRGNLKKAQARLTQLIKARDGLTENTPEWTLKNSEVMLQTKMVTNLGLLVTKMEEQINSARRSQQMGELNFQMLDSQRDLANAEAKMSIDERHFAEMRTAIAEAQMSAMGIIKGASAIKDNRKELRRRANRATGQAEVAERLASSMTDFNPTVESLSDEEQAVYNDAVKRASGASASSTEGSSNSAN